jgi:FeS assembly SUF system protein
MSEVKTRPIVLSRPITDIQADIVEEIKKIYDPEIPVNIYELGLIYEVHVSEEGRAHILMTLTAPACPAAEMLPKEVEERALDVADVISAEVEITFEPPWDQEMMSEEARLELGFM